MATRSLGSLAVAIAMVLGRRSVEGSSPVRPLRSCVQDSRTGGGWQGFTTSRKAGRRAGLGGGPRTRRGSERCRRIPRQGGSGWPSSAPARSATTTTSRRSGSTRGPSWSPPATPTPPCSSDASARVGHRPRHDRSRWSVCDAADIDAVIIATPNFTHRADRRGGGAGGQARHVREAAGPECRRGPRDVRGGPRRRRRPHDGLHLPLRPVDALPAAPAQVGRPGHAPALPLAAVPRLARDELGLAAVQGQGRRRRPVRHDDPPDRLRASTCSARSRRVCGAVARFAPRDETPDGQPCPPSDVDDWSCLIGEFASGATGVWEGTTLAKGYGRDGFGHEWAEVNGSEGSAVYRLHEPNTILLGRDRPGPRPRRRPRRVPQARRQPPRPGPGRAGHRLPLRPGLGVRLRDRRGPRRRPQLPRRPERPDRRRRRARVVRPADLDRDAHGDPMNSPARLATFGSPWDTGVQSHRTRRPDR